MLDRILVPLDGSPLADGILTVVRRLLVRRDAAIRLLRVMPDTLAGGTGAFPEQAREDVERHLRRLRDDLVAAGATADLEVRTGDPAARICAAADAWDASCIAMSTHGRSGPARWLYGSVTARVLEAARQPLLVANRRAIGEPEAPAREARFRRILVPLDGSERAARVLPLALGIAKLYDAEVVLLHVTPSLPLPRPDGAVDPPPSEAELRARVEPWRAQAAAAGVKVRVVVAFDAVADRIVDSVNLEQADLVALTSHGRSGIERWVFGSIAEKVIRACAVPLLVLRTAEAPRA